MGSQEQDFHKEYKNSYIMLNIFFDNTSVNSTIYKVIGIVGCEFGLIYLIHNSSCSQKNELDHVRGISSSS